jgi:RNA polymerase sigma factor (sigma-70 family)
LSKTELITEEKEQRLVARAKDGDTKAMQELLDAYKPGILAQVRTVTPFMDHDDAVQEARLVFMGMVHSHDPSKGRLANRIKKELGHALKEASTLARNAFSIPPRTQRRFLSILRKADHNVSLAADIAEENGMARFTFLQLYGILIGTVSLDSAVYAEASPLAEPVFVDVDTVGLVEKAKAALDQQERVVVDDYYGFSTYEPKTDKEIGYDLGLKPNQVMRIRHRALGKMRKAVYVYA